MAKTDGSRTTARLRRRIGIVCLAGWATLVALMLVWQGDASPAHAETATASSQPAKDETAVQPARQPTAVEIMQELMKKRQSRPPIPPTRPERKVIDPLRTPTSRPGPGPKQEGYPLKPDGSMLVDRVGRLIQRPKGWFLVFESEGKVLREPPMQILPNRDLQTMEEYSANGTRPVKFRVSGEVTEYRGSNYLLVRKVLVVHGLGNLK